MTKAGPPIPEITQSEVVYTGFFDVHVDHLRLPHGIQMTYSVVDLHTHAAAIIAETEEEKIITIYEYRHPLRRWVLGCPGGRIDAGESPIETGKRELLEETGFGGGTFSQLGTVCPLPAVTGQQITFLHAQGVSLQAPPSPEAFELIRVELKTKEEIFEEIRQGALVDGVFCTALFLWSMYRA